MDKVAVLIPCYNESQTIEKVILDYKRVLPEAKIYVYDNNSTDETARIAREAGAIVRYENKQGKGNVIRRMFREIDADCYLMIDGDDTYPAEAAPQMINEIIINKMDMVVGDRLSSTYFSENKRLFHNMGNTVTRFFINHIFHSNIKDVMTGMRSFSYQFVKTFPVLSQGFEIETEMTIHAVDKNLNIQNVVIDYRDRPEGSVSKLNTIPDGIKVLGTIAKLFKNYQPGKFFGVISILLFFFSFIFFLPVLLEYFETGLVRRFPTLIVCGFTFITSIISFFSGTILQTIIQKDKQGFEFRLQLINSEYKKIRSK